MTFVLINQKIANCKKNFTIWQEPTPARSHFISGLKSQVLKHFWLKMMVKSFEIHQASSDLLLPSTKEFAQKDWIGLAG